MAPEFDVVDLGPADHPAEEEHAPDFVRPLVSVEYWEDSSLSELLESGPVLLVFHPMAGAFPATYLWNELRDRDVGAFEASIVGLTISTPYDLTSFVREHDLEDTGIRFFSDPANDVAEQYGIVHDLDGMTGIEEPRPATFLIDQDGTITHTWVAREWPEFPNYDELIAALERVTGE